MSASSMVSVGPGSSREKSNTRIPSKSFIPSPPSAFRRQLLAPRRARQWLGASPDLDRACFLEAGDVLPGIAMFEQHFLRVLAELRRVAPRVGRGLAHL